MRVAAAILLFAVLCLTGSSIAWLRATDAAPSIPEGAAPEAMLASFESATRPEGEIDLAARYAGRLDLIDPRLALPTWHKHARDEAVMVHVATRTCPPVVLPNGGAELHDAALAKAYAWHAATCAGGTPPEEQVRRPPFMHPSGRSYAASARARLGDGASAWAAEHARAFHVLELGELEPATLEPADRALASIAANAWEGLTRGDRIVLTASSLVVADRGSLGLTKIRVYRRSAWDSFARGASLALAARSPAALCVRPASPDLCWEARSAADRHRPALLFGTSASAALVLCASLALGLAYVGERRRLHADRIHVLRTLTHELRTPATSLRLDIEPLRAAYDELPASCQEPLLRISDGIERLHRVLHRSARYMALFENKSGISLVKIRAISSAKELFEELSEEWPEGVTLTGTAQDRGVSTDPEWLSVAVRNLVENGARHGTPPVSVRWTIDGSELVIRVEDHGRSPKLSLRRAIAPHQRDDDSPGLGLGLAIVDRVARLLGGRLSHEPDPTTFELRVLIDGDPS